MENLIFAARGKGVGATLTTLLLAREADVRAVVGAPEELPLVGRVPLGFPARVFGRPPRHLVSDVAFLEPWGAPIPAAPRRSHRRRCGTARSGVPGPTR